MAPDMRDPVWDPPTLRPVANQATPCRWRPRRHCRHGRSADVRVLVVEDVRSLADDIAEGLPDNGFAVDVAYDGVDASVKLDTLDYQVVVLDRDLPGIHGDVLCPMITEADRPVMVLMLTAAGSAGERVAHPGWARDRSSVGYGAPGRPRLTARHFPQCHLVGEALDDDRAPQEEFVHGGDRSPSCGTSAPAGVPLAKGIRPLGRQCHRPSSNTASLGDEGVKGRLVHDQGRQLQEGCPAPRRGDWAALHRSADGSRGSRCANAPRASSRAATRSSPGSLRH